MTRKIIWLFIVVAIILILVFYLYQQKKAAPEVHLSKASYTLLPGWEIADTRNSFSALLRSCRVFLKKPPTQSVGSKHIELLASDWHPLCKNAKQINANSKKQTRAFFEKWFSPAQFYTDRPIKGLFTGYYMPVVKGSLEMTERFNIPIYGVPNDLVSVSLGALDPELKHHRRLFGRVEGHSLIPYHSRKEIMNGRIKKTAPKIAWIDSPVDLQFLEIEGSGIIELEDGQQVAIGYAAQNGLPYTSIAKVLIDRGVLTKHNASMQGIRKYFKENPHEIEDVLFQNKSFVFFEKQKDAEAYGSQGVALTPGYSMAVDRKWVPMGVPLWLDTTRPDKKDKKKPLKRLMIAQDTGGAIKGPVRGDLYWGTGEEAIFIAGHMKNMGYYWLLLPKSYYKRQNRDN